MTSEYEKLGAFYLGRVFDFDHRTATNELLLYDAKDLTTHAMCVGMTGSGKTGLCLALLEEAAIDGIPAICIDPKGDLGNLMLTFPNLAAVDFLPWMDPAEATRQGLTVDQLAAATAARWKKGLADWGQEPARIQRLRDAAEVVIYTPGAKFGVPLTLLRSFDAPSPAVLSNADSLRERIMTSVSGLLGLLGAEADPIRSREHILLSTIFDCAWRQGRNLDLGGLIREIQQPPFQQIGVMDLETVFPAADRFGLSMQLNNLLASPGFQAWSEGEPLDINRLLYTDAGKPRLSIVSIAHLSDSERMFFVTTLLNEMVSWMRAQSGTSSLRALLYMDEVFGYFPPTANPPSKLPMLTLLKQARAFGLGVVLATQNPVDIDYKGLSNCGTWFLGRLQTERDKARVLDGLEGASATAGKTFDRARMESILSGLGNRIFLMNNVHDDAPVVFQSRWALSYLRGPLSRTHIEQLMGSVKAPNRAAAVSPPSKIKATADMSRPVLPPGIDELFAAPHGQPSSGQRLVYRPAVYGLARVHYAQSSVALDEWRTLALLSLPEGAVGNDVWGGARCLDLDRLELTSHPVEGAAFQTLPPELSDARRYTAWKVSLKNHLYRTAPLALFQSPALKQVSRPDESERDFRIRLQQQAFEKRDLEIEKLRKKYTPKLTTLDDRIRRARVALEREKSQAGQQTLQSVLSVGTTLLGALFSRKKASVSNVTRAASAMKSASRIGKERSDIGHAEESIESLQQQLQELEVQFQTDTEAVKETYSLDKLELGPFPVTPRKSDLAVEKVALVWTPWLVDEKGLAQPAFAWDATS